MGEVLSQGSYVRGDSQDAGKSWARFFIEPVPNKLKSDEAGRPIFDEVEMVEIVFAGNQFTKPVRTVTDEHRNRYATAYRAFKDKKEFAIDGTPLEQWPSAGMSVGRIAEFKAIGIMTVENLASLDDNGIQRLGIGAREMVAKARAYLEITTKNAPIENLAAENVRLSEDISRLTDKLTETQTLLDRVTSVLESNGISLSAVASAEPIAPGKGRKKAAA